MSIEIAMDSQLIRVLLVEDNPGDARLVQIMLLEASNLTDLRFEHQHVLNLREALDIMADDYFDIVLLDLSLPDSMGLETISRMKSIDPIVPVVVMTGSNNLELGVHAVQAGAQDYLVKGSTDHQLLARSLRYAIERRRVEMAYDEVRMEQLRTQAATDERERIAHELHDSVNQTLFTASVVAESALRKLDSDKSKTRELLEQLHHLTRVAMAEMRVLLIELHPIALTRIPFKVLVEQLVTSLTNRRIAAFELQVGDDLPPLPPDVQVALYRMLQEALTNVTRHANASHVHVEVVCRADEDDVENDVYEGAADGKTTGGAEQRKTLKIAVRDDGDGFNPEEVSPQSLGLEIMRERAGAINAALSVNSEAGKGTEVIVKWPFTN